MQRIRRYRYELGSQKLTIFIALWWLGAYLSTGLAAGPAWAQSESKAPAPTWFAQSMASSQRGGLNVVYFWSSGATFRSESVMGGRPVVTIVSGNTYYAYDALTMQGIAIGRAKKAIAADSPDRRPFGNEFETMLRLGAEEIREEELGGVMCDVYQLTSDVGRQILWLNQDSQVPARVELYDRQSGTTRYKEFFNWRKNLPIVDAFFRPDPAVEFKRFELAEYLVAISDGGSIGPVPVLYGELLHGPDR